MLVKFCFQIPSDCCENAKYLRDGTFLLQPVVHNAYDEADTQGSPKSKILPNHQ